MQQQRQLAVLVRPSARVIDLLPQPRPARCQRARPWRGAAQAKATLIKFQRCEDKCFAAMVVQADEAAD
ncbi:hypothetical protein, partial [Xanthomonas axonopodis]